MAPVRTLIAGVVLGALSHGANATCSKPLTMVAEDWPPYSFTNADGVQTGLDMDLTRAILREAGCTLIVQPVLPSLRRTVLFEQGKVDLMLAASDLPARRRYARFSAPYRHETVGLFTLASHAADYRTIDGFGAVDARGLSLLAPRAGYYGPAYAQRAGMWRDTGRLFEFGSFDQGMRMLSAERAQLIMGDVAAISDAAQHAHLSLYQLTFSVHSAPVHLMLSKATTTPADLATIDAAIARLDKAGTLQAIRNRYGVR